MAKSMIIGGLFLATILIWGGVGLKRYVDDQNMYIQRLKSQRGALALKVDTLKHVARAVQAYCSGYKGDAADFLVEAVRNYEAKGSYKFDLEGVLPSEMRWDPELQYQGKKLEFFEYWVHLYLDTENLPEPPPE